MAYLDNCTEEQRRLLTTPSKALLKYKAFAATFKARNPSATGNQIQHEYQVSEYAKNAARTCVAIDALAARDKAAA